MQDFIKSITDGIADAFNFGEITIGRILITLVLSFVLGLFVYFVYRKTFAGVMYSRNFGISLVMLSMVTATIIMPITSNLTLSLGTVGALSIVRFRTAVKEPMDSAFMFWSIALGIMLGARFFLPAIVCSLIMGLLMIVLSSMKLRSTMPFILVVRYSEDATKNVNELFKRMPEGRVKSRTVTRTGIELTVELRLRNSDTQVVDRFLQIPGVFDAALISYSGDIVA